MKLFFAAPLSGLPSDPMALGAHTSRLHFARKEVRAAPASSRPFFPIALFSLFPAACAAAERREKAVSKPASISRVIFCSPSLGTLAVVAFMGMSNCVVRSGGLRLPCSIIAKHSVEGCDHFSHD